MNLVDKVEEEIARTNNCENALISLLREKHKLLEYYRERNRTMSIMMLIGIIMAAMIGFAVGFQVRSVI